MAEVTPILELNAVGREFDDGQIVGVRDVSLTILPGELVAIHGASGSGKSTLINLMSGMDVPTAGDVSFDGRKNPSPADWTRLRSGRLGLMFQDFNLLPTFSAQENVELAMFGHLKTAKARQAAALARLTEVGVAHCAGRRPPQLSGGERSRVALARSLANAPDVLMADEPTSNLDTANGAAVTDMLLSLHAKGGLTLIIVSHDTSLIARCTRTVQMRDGAVVADLRRGQ